MRAWSQGGLPPKAAVQEWLPLVTCMWPFFSFPKQLSRSLGGNTGSFSVMAPAPCASAPVSTHRQSSWLGGRMLLGPPPAGQEVEEAAPFYCCNGHCGMSELVREVRESTLYT